MESVKLVDVTLRDGSYAVDFRFDRAFVREILHRLDSSGIDLIEIGHGLGLEAERGGAKSCNISATDWMNLANESLSSAKWGFFAQPHFSRAETIASLASAGMSFLRVGMRAEHIRNNLDYLNRVVDSCGSVYLNLMKTSATDVKKLPALLSGIPENIAGVYVVDSFGAMLPGDVKRYVRTVADYASVVGFHGHDNLGMANANSLAAAEAGAKLIDGSLAGVGRGAGNTQIESMAAMFELKWPGTFGYTKLADHASFCRESIKPISDDRSIQVLGGAFGVHSELFPEIITLAQEYNLELTDIMSIAARLTRTCDEHDLRKALNTTFGRQRV